MSADSRLILFLLLLLVVKGDSTNENTSSESDINRVGCILTFVFPVILIIAAIIQRFNVSCNTIEEFALAGRSLSATISSIVMISSWVCGGYVFGTAESVVTKGRGILWTQAPWAFSLSFILNSFLFCERLREKDMFTIFDVFAEKFTGWLIIILYLPCIIGEVSWIAIILSSCRNFISIVLGVQPTLLTCYILLCSLFIVLIGGMHSLKITGFLNFFVMFFSVLIALISVHSSPMVDNIMLYKSSWLGTIQPNQWGIWCDETLVILLGGTCWQVYYQQMLSCKSNAAAHTMSLFSGLGTMLFGFASGLMGIYASSVDWSQIKVIQSLTGKESNVLSYCIRYLMSPIARVICIIGILATILSSLSGNLLSSSTLFSLNIYRNNCHIHASDNEIIWVGRCYSIVVSSVGLVVSYSMQMTYLRWIQLNDLIYVLLFPQLLLFVWLRHYTNSYGAISALIIGIILRSNCGMKGNQAVCWNRDIHNIPYRTCIVIIEMIVEVGISALWRYCVITKEWIWMDFLQAYTPKGIDQRCTSHGSQYKKYKKRRSSSRLSVKTSSTSRTSRTNSQNSNNTTNTTTTNNNNNSKQTLKCAI